MDINVKTAEENTENIKKSLFDPVEVKGISLKSAKAFFSGRFARMLRSISRLFSFTPARVYGLAFLSFGILTLFLHLGEYYFMENPKVEVSSLIIGAAFVILSIFFLPSDKPICTAVQSVKLFDFIVFDFFLISRMNQSDGKSRINGAVGIVSGFLLAVLGFFIPTEYSVLVILGLLLVITARVSPEFPYIISLFLFPYFPILPYSSYILALLVTVTMISFVRKVFVGKRIFSFEIYDFLFLLLIMSVFVTAVILGGSASTERALLTVLFLVGYFPASNMAVNRRLFDCVASSLTVSAIPVALYSIVSYIISCVSGAPESSKAFFGSSEIFAAYLCAVVTFALFLAVNRRRKLKKAYYLGVFILALLALVTTEMLVLLAVLILGLISLGIIRTKKIHCILLIPVALLPVGLLFVGDSVLSKISEIFYVSPALTERKLSAYGAFDFFVRNPILGTGINNPFTSSDFSSSLYLGMACRFGVLAFTVFLLLMILRVCHFSLFKKYFSDSTVNFYAEISLLASVCMLVIGSLADIFADIEMVYFFVTVFSVGSSALRISKREKEEMRSYYRELGRSDLAAIDVTLKK